MNDLISRKALCEYALNQKDKSVTPNDIMRFPSAQPYSLDEWCDTCKEYDHEKHCCPRYNRVIRDAVSEAQPEIIRCMDCKFCVDLNHDGDYSCLTAYGYRHIDRLDWYCADAERRGRQNADR